MWQEVRLIFGLIRYITLRKRYGSWNVCRNHTYIIVANFIFKNWPHTFQKNPGIPVQQLRRTMTNLGKNSRFHIETWVKSKRMNHRLNVLGSYGCIRDRKFNGTLNHMIDSCHYLTCKVSTLHVIFVILQWYIDSETLCISERDRITVNDKSRDGRRTRTRSVSMCYLGTIPGILKKTGKYYVIPMDGTRRILLFPPWPRGGQTYSYLI
jgi:hypothetical protein